MTRVVSRPTHGGRRASATERSDGQALVEFALIAPLLFIFLFGIVQFGFLFGGQIGLTNAVREAARYASTAPPDADVAGQLDLVLPRSVPGYAASAAVKSVSYCWYQNPGSQITYSQRVVVQVTYGHTLFVPLVGALVDGIDGVTDNRFRAGAREEMRVEAPPVRTQPGGSACANA